MIQRRCFGAKFQEEGSRGEVHTQSPHIRMKGSKCLQAYAHHVISGAPGHSDILVCGCTTGGLNTPCCTLTLHSHQHHPSPTTSKAAPNSTVRSPNTAQHQHNELPPTTTTAQTLRILHNTCTPTSALPLRPHILHGYFRSSALATASTPP